MADPLAREIQMKFFDLAKNNLRGLRDALRNSSDDELRAAAVYVMSYAADKRIIIDDLQYALRDADPSVRANAVQGLLAMWSTRACIPISRSTSSLPGSSKC